MKPLVDNHQFPENSYGQVSFKKIGTRLCVSGKQPASESGNEIWFLTLSDLLMLLMVCFVLLFGITLKQQISSPADQTGRIQVTQQASVTNEQKTIQVAATDSAANEATTLMESDLLDILGDNQSADRITVESHSRYIVLTFPEQIVFDSGQAQLKTSARPVLEKLAFFIQNHSSLSVEIHGHTDDLPINSRRYPSNWELSADRATQVAKALMQFGIDPSRLSTKGFGEYHPLYPNDSDANRFKNRRVELKFSLSESA
jgi:chemotaxis protein MotB